MPKILPKLLLIIFVATSLHAQPDTLWTRIYEGSPGRDGCKKIISTFDGGYLLGGYQHTPEDGSAFVAVKIDSSCEQQWRWFYQQTYHDLFYSAAQSVDSCYLIAGYSNVEGPTGIVLKINHAGETIWSRSYGGHGSDLYEIIALPTGDIVATGDSSRYGYLIRLNGSGEVIWQKTYDEGLFGGLKHTRDDGFIMVGQSTYFGNSIQGYVVKVDSDGEEQWHGDYGDVYQEAFGSVVELENGDFVFGGAVRNDEEDIYDFWLVKTDPEGEVIWQRQYHENFTCRLKDLITLPDGELMFVGQRFNDYRRHGNYVAYRLDADGDVVWNLYFGPRGDAIFYSVLLLEDNSYLFAGEYYPREAQLGRFTEFWLVRTEPDTFDVNDVDLLDPAFPASWFFEPPFPNPFNNVVRIRYSLPIQTPVIFTVHDADGRKIGTLFNNIAQPGIHEQVWSVSSLPAGIYFIKVQTNLGATSSKVTLVK